MTRRHALVSSAAAGVAATFPLPKPARAADFSTSEYLRIRQVAFKRVAPRSEAVFYVTNRNQTASPDLALQFGSSHSEVSFGLTRSDVYSRWGAYPEPPQITAVEQMSHAEFLQALRSLHKRVILFVHGFNTSWAESITTAAQLEADIGLDAKMVVFSWSSRESFLDYPGDEEQIAASVGDLCRLLIDILESSQVSELHIVAHSMGARGAVAALKAIYKSAKRSMLRKIVNVVYAAPDIEQHAMTRDYLPVWAFAHLATTVYASNRDWAMWLSERFHGSPRVGSIGKTIYIQPGIVTVDVSRVDKSAWGHSAIFDSRELASDLYYVVARHLPPDSRHGLRRIQTASGVYWQMN